MHLDMHLKSPHSGGHRHPMEPQWGSMGPFGHLLAPFGSISAPFGSDSRIPGHDIDRFIFHVPNPTPPYHHLLPGLPARNAPHLPHKLHEEGIEPNPGPHPQGRPGPHPQGRPNQSKLYRTDREFSNCTSIENNFDLLACRSAHFLFLNETTLPESRHAAMQSLFAEKKRQLLISPTDPETTRPSAGVGLIVRKPRNAKKLVPVTNEFRALTSAGRADIYGVGIGHNYMLVVINFYGWTGSHTCAEAQDRTTDLMRICFLELESREEHFHLLVCDLNADTQDIGILQQQLDAHSLTDLGAHAAAWGGYDNEHTCIAPNTLTPTRRDYCFCCNGILPYITNFNVDHSSLLPVHSVLKITITIPEFPVVIRSSKGPASLHSHLVDHLISESKQYVYPPDRDNTHGEEESPPPDSPLHPSYKAFVNRYHEALTEHFKHAAHFLEGHLTTRDSNKFYRLWAKTIVDAFNSCLGKGTHNKGNKLHGHGCVNIREGPLQDSRDDYEAELPIGILELQRISRICTQMADRFRILRRNSERNKSLSQRKRGEFQDLNLEATAILRGLLKPSIATDLELLGDLDHLDPLALRSCLRLQRHAQSFGKAFEDKKQDWKKLQKTIHGEKLKADKHLKGAFSRLRPPQASPLLFATRPCTGPNGQPPGTIATHPDEVDNIAIQAGKSIYDGNVRNVSALVTSFLSKYGRFIPTLSAALPFTTNGSHPNHRHFAINRITGQQLSEVLKQVKPSAQGLDHIFAQDLKLLNTVALDWLAALYNNIEEGAPWPEPCLQVRTAYLSKPDGDPFKPQDYRNLSITSVTYRLWATTRLRDITPWAESWRIPGIFAGLPGVGAEDAWYITSVYLEEAKLTNTPYLGAAADIWKCFDQIVRPMLYAILRLMGLPVGMLNAYSSFLDNLVFINSLAGGLGKPHKRACGIPQGCPLSMLFIAAMFRPWLVLMQTMHVVGRILADDIMILGFGEQGHNQFQEAYDATHLYFCDLGAKISTKKCYAFASHSTTRNWLANHTWQHLNAKVKVVWHIRDLGGHLNSTVGTVATTLAARLKQAALYARHIRFINVDDAAKHRLIVSKILSLGLYGCEASPANQSSLRYLQNSIATIVSGSSSRTNPAVSFATFGHGRDLDPCVHIFTRRGLLLRRMYYKHPDIQPCVHNILGIYSNHNYKGTNTSPSSLVTLWPAPPPLTPHSKLWDPTFRPCGPVGLFVLSCHRNATAVDTQMCIHAHGERPLSLLHTPQQNVVPHLDAIAIRARTTNATGRRTTFGFVQEIDQHVMLAAIKDLPDDHRRIARHYYTGGAWANDLLRDIGRASSSKCDLCGGDDSITHFWECPKLAEARVVPDSPYNHLTKDYFSAAMQLGLAPAMAASHLDTFWGHQQLPDTSLSDRWLLGAWNTDELRNSDKAICLINHAWLPEAIAITPPGQPIHSYQNARQIFDRASGEVHHTFSLPRIATVDGIAPDSPNLFADGATSLPKTLQWSTASMGIFYPKRIEPFTEVEKHIMNCTIHNDHQAEAFSAVSGPSAASTRSELGAMLGAALAPFPAHVGMDNLTVVKRTAKLIAGQPVHPYKPWQLLPDGHLWHHLADAIRQRGPCTFAVSWVKGHAKDVHIRKGITTDWHRDCNDKADAIAEKGQVRSHPDGLRQLGIIFRDRQKRYIDLVKHVHKVIIQTHIEAARLRTQAKNALHPRALGKKHVQWFPVAKSLVWSSDDGSTHFPLVQVPKVTPKVHGSSTLYSQVWSFLSHIKAKHPTGETPGVTWIELAALFVMRGGSLDLRNEAATSATTRTTLPQAVSAFKAAIRMVIRDNPAPTICKYFGPSTCAARRLNPLGFDNHLPSVACLPVATQAESEAICKFLLNLRCCMKRTTQDRLEDGSLWLPKAKLTLKGVPNWARFLGTSSTLQQHLAEKSQQFAQLQSEAVANNHTFIVVTCPVCGYRKRSAPSKLIDAARWKYTWCGGTCRKNSSASRWLCSCAIPWHTCTKHSVCEEQSTKKHVNTNHLQSATPIPGAKLTLPSTAINHYTQPRYPPHSPSCQASPDVSCVSSFSNPPSTAQRHTDPNLPNPPTHSNGLNLEPEPTQSHTPVALAKVKRSLVSTESRDRLPKVARHVSSLRGRFAFGRVSKEHARSLTAEVQRDLASKQGMPGLEQQGLVSQATEVDDQPRFLGPGPSSGAPFVPGAPSSPGPFGTAVSTPASASGPGPLACLPAQDGPRPTPPRHNLCGQAKTSVAQPVLQLRATERAAVKRKRSLQDTGPPRDRCRPTSLDPSAAYPAIFARSPLLARRFAHLVGSS